jgi:RimJ/RimL family protein N-acetyltransferase
MLLTTPRLAIRELQIDDDWDGLYALYSDPDYQRFESPVLSKDQTLEKLEGYIQEAKSQPRTSYWLAVIVPPDDTLIGKIALRLNNSSIREWEIGWGIHPACWGRGFAPEAAKAMLELAFKHLDAHKVVAFCHANNRASIRVMEKIGMRREAWLRETRYLNGQWFDEYAYGILEKEYKE